MKVMIVYDSVSAMKLTAKVAETIGGVLKEKAIEVDSFSVKDVDRAAVKNYDCLIAGAPTMAFRASRGIMQFLNSFSDNEFSGKLGAAFDTQLQSRLSGNAAEGIMKKLKKLGFQIITPPLVTYVTGKTNEQQLKEGEPEKTRNWAQEIAKTLSK
ncbi:MAG: flavodoxin domain-containing protein [Candidatus Bathyarchaeia archaeon]|jgi:flavodoxin